MAVKHPIKAFDHVQLTEPVDDAPTGARGGVLEFMPSGRAMVEILDPPLGPAARIVFAPVEVLRWIDPSWWTSDAQKHMADGGHVRVA
jgi:hypothetical protein